MKDTKKDMTNYWNNRAKRIKRYRDEAFYTVTDISFYAYRRNRTLEIQNTFYFDQGGYK